jgi:protein SCO1/2
LVPLALVAFMLVCVMVVSWFGMNRSLTPGPAGEAAGSLPLFPADDEAAALASLVIPEFTLTDQEGHARTRDIFKDRWTVLAFTFTNCTTVCPIMHGHLIRLQSEMAGTPLRIVSISVDPAHDTPAALKAFAEKISADPERWTFLTGDAATIQSILAGLRFTTGADPSLTITLPGGGTMANIVHPSRIILIGPDATVRAMETGLDWSGPEAVLRRVRM